MWLILGIVVGLVAGLLIGYTRNHSLSVPWYSWLLMAVGVVLILLTVDTFVNSFAEWEPKAAWLSLLFFGLPGIIVGGLGLYLALPRKKRERKKREQAPSQLSS